MHTNDHVMVTCTIMVTLRLLNNIMSATGLMKSLPKTSNATLVALVTISLLTSAVVTASGNLQLVFAQQPPAIPAQPAQPQSPQPQSQQQQQAPLNFYLK